MNSILVHIIYAQGFVSFKNAAPVMGKPMGSPELCYRYYNRQWYTEETNVEELAQ